MQGDDLAITGAAVDVGNSDELEEQPNWDGFGGLPPETGGDASAGRDKEGGYRWRGNAFT